MYRQSEKNAKQQYFLHASSQYGERRPTNGWDRLASLGHPRKFQTGFGVLASLLHRRRSTEVNQTLHDVWPSSALVHYIHFWGSCCLTEFCQVQNALCIQVFRSPILAALLVSSRDRAAIPFDTARSICLIIFSSFPYYFFLFLF